MYPNGCKYIKCIKVESFFPKEVTGSTKYPWFSCHGYEDEYSNLTSHCLFTVDAVTSETPVKKKRQQGTPSSSKRRR